ncbi:MAG: hypothetical protein PHY28_09035, partial [Dehalococcoidales bacterium]|nr:hypothetical protein [Dehalococcoidales bacterium]
MCIYCDIWGEGKVWYLNPKNYARQMYTLNPPASKPRPPRGEADPNSLTKNYKAIVDAMTVGPEALETATNVIRGGSATGEEGPVGGWWGQVVPLRDAERMVEIANPLGLLGCVCRLHYLALEEQNEEEFTCMGLGVGMLKWER